MIIGYAYVIADILHEGHMLFLENCRALCDKLVVGVLTDEATMEKKPRPVMSFEQRVRVVRGLRCVDAVVAQETYSPVGNVVAIQPDILFESTSHDDVSGDGGIRVVQWPYYPKESSTNIKERVRGAQS